MKAYESEAYVMYTRWNCSLLVVAIFIVTNYVALRYRYLSYRISSLSKYPEYKKMYPAAVMFYSGLQQCCNPLFCPLDGEWIMRNDISYKKLNTVLNTNMQLRMRKGWPTSLFHGDQRCGKKYPLARLLKYNNTEAYYSDIVSQCDGLSQMPCCKDDIGWCGRGPFFCSCQSCTDYSAMIYAELYMWMHRHDCRYVDIETNASCAYLQQTFSSITFIGDSLVRHVFSSLLIHLTNDNLYGALKPGLNERDLQFCGGENQFVDSSCHVKLATKWGEIQANPKYCHVLKGKPKLEFVQAYSSQFVGLALQTIAQTLQEARPLIFIGIGIHDNFNSSKVISTFMNPIVNLIRSRLNSKSLVVWLNTHSAGPLKPLGFQESQGNPHIRRYNEDMVKYCQDNSIIFFDTYNITKGVHSFDGTHYGSALNQLKIKLIINGLKDIPIPKIYEP